MSDPESKTSALSVGQRLCASRYVLQTKLFDNPEGSAYWVGKERDAREDVILFFLPPFLKFLLVFFHEVFLVLFL